MSQLFTPFPTWHFNGFSPVILKRSSGTLESSELNAVSTTLCQNANASSQAGSRTMEGGPVVGALSRMLRQGRHHQRRTVDPSSVSRRVRDTAAPTRKEDSTQCRVLDRDGGGCAKHRRRSAGQRHARSSRDPESQRTNPGQWKLGRGQGPAHRRCVRSVPLPAFASLVSTDQTGYVDRK